MKDFSTYGEPCLAGELGVDGVLGREGVLEILQLVALPDHGHQETPHTLDRRLLQLMSLEEIVVNW